jgi:predicted dehydrogenase
LKDKKLRIGIIGLGKMGLLHASLANIFPDVQLAVLCDKSALMTRVCKSIFSSTDITIINDVKRLSEFDLDAAYITTPISSHYAIIKELLTNAVVKNIFSEKTLTSNYYQAKELVEIADKIGGTTMVGYMKRFSVVFRKAKELLTEGTLGNLLSFNAYAYSSDFLGLTKTSTSSASRGGALNDIGCHTIDLALWLLGDLTVDEIISCYKINGSEVAVSFKSSNSSNLTGQFDVSQRLENYRLPEFGCSIEGSNGKLEVNDDRLKISLYNGTSKIWYRHDLNDNTAFALGETEYYRENKEFIDAIVENRKCDSNFNSASRVNKIIDQVRQGLQNFE